MGYRRWIAIASFGVMVVGGLCAPLGCSSDDEIVGMGGTAGQGGSIGGGGQGSENGPLVFITRPSGEPGFTTSSSPIMLEGFAEDDDGIAEITWQNAATDGSGTANPATSWSIASVELVEGDNRITVQATDTTGEANQAEVLAVYNPYLAFQDRVIFSETEVHPVHVLPVLVTVGIVPNENLVAGSVKLIRVDPEDHAELQEVAQLYDDGTLENGDDIAADWTFSTLLHVDALVPGYRYYRVTALTEDGGVEHQALSEVIEVAVLPRMTQADFDELYAVADAAMERVDAGQSAEETAAWLREQPDVAIAEASEGGRGVWWVYENGILGGLVVPSPDHRGGAAAQSRLSARGRARPSARSGERLEPACRGERGEPGTMRPLAGEDDPFAIDNHDALYVGPFVWDFGASDDYNGAWNIVAQSHCPTLTPTELKNDAREDTNTGPSVWRSLSNYGAVVICSHGDTWFQGLFGVWEDRFGDQSHDDPDLADPRFGMRWWQKPFAQVVVAAWKPASALLHQKDVMMHRLVIMPTLGFGITPSYIKHYAKSFPKSIVWVGSCRSLYNKTMASAFIANGAQAYYGFSEYVLPSYAQPVGTTVFEQLVNQQKTVQEAFDQAVGDHGPHDGDVPAYFLRAGIPQAHIGDEVPTNGSFEEGLSGWNPTGDCRAISSLGAVSPQHESRMSIVSTGLGAVLASTSVLTQTFCVPQSAENLTFQYNVVSEEPDEWVGTEFDDKFSARLKVGDGGWQLLAFESINGSSWTPLGGDYFGGGDDTTYHTGWRDVSHSLADARGQDVTLEFRVWDRGDSIYDTAALIDQVEIEPVEE